MINTKYLLLANRFLGESIPLLPLLALYFSESGLSVSLIAIVFATLAVTVFLFEIPAGVLADKVDLKSILIISRILKLAAFTCFLAEPTTYGFILGSFLWGLSSALDSGTFQGYVFQLLKNHNKPGSFGKWYGQAMTASVSGTLLAAGIATQVAEIGFYSLQIIGVVAIAVSLLCTFLLPKVPRESVEQTPTETQSSSFLKTVRSIQFTKMLVIILLIGVSAGAVKGTLDDYTPLLLTSVGWSLATVGYAVFLIYALQASGTLTGSYLSTRSNRQWLYLFICGVAFMLIGLVATPLVVLLCLGLVIILDGVLWVQNDTALQEAATDQNRVTIASVKNFLTEICAFLILGLIWLVGDSVNLIYMYLAAGLLLVAVAISARLSVKNV